jgi:hypothetical protein
MGVQLDSRGRCDTYEMQVVLVVRAQPKNQFYDGK